MNIATYTARSALRNRRRTVLTVMSIGVSLALIVILDTFLQEITKPTGLNEAVPRFVVRHRTSLTQSLPRPYLDKIRNARGVAAVTPMQWFGGQYKDDRIENMFPRFAVDMRTFFDVFPDYSPLRPEYIEDVYSDRTACLVGDILVERHGMKIGDRIIIRGDIFPYDLELTVRGTFTGFNPDWLLFNIEYLDELQGGVAQVGAFFATSTSAENLPEVIARLDDMFRNAEAPVRVETEKAFILSFVEMLGNIQFLIRGIVSVVIFAILLIAASTMAMAVRERTREVAMLKTVGFTRQTVMGIIVAEGLALSLLGGLIGVGGAAVLLPNPKHFICAIAGAAVAGIVGVAIMLVGLAEGRADGPMGLITRARRVVGEYSGTLSLAAGLLTSALLLAALPPISWFEFSNGFIPFLNVRPETMMMGGLITLAVGLFSSVVPAWNASRMGVIDGLRTVG